MFYLLLILSIGLHASNYLELLEALYVIPFHELSLLPGLGRTLVYFRHAYSVEFWVNMGFE
jgi:hypothetical protein